MLRVLAVRGPAAHQLFDLDDAEAAAATGASGWAMPYEPGEVIEWDENAPYSTDWTVPGYYIPPELVPTPPTSAPVDVSFIGNDSPARVHVMVAEMSKFVQGDTVTLAGATGEYAVCNGAHTVGIVDGTIGWFELVGVDMSAAAAADTEPGVTVTPATRP